MVWNNSLKDTRKKIDFNTHEPAQHGAYGPRWAKAWLALARHGMAWSSMARASSSKCCFTCLGPRPFWLEYQKKKKNIYSVQVGVQKFLPFACSIGCLLISTITSAFCILIKVR